MPGSSHPPASCQAWTKDSEESSFIGLSADPVTQTLEEIMEIKRQLARPDIHHNMHAKVRHRQKPSSLSKTKQTKT